MQLRRFSKRHDDVAQTAEQLPPALPYPRGWFCLGFSDEWKPGTIRTRLLMGEDVVLYRTRRGKLSAIRPYCPHLGTHLGVGGTVNGEELICPFHKFAFGLDGTCVRTPYGSPPKASLAVLPVCEVNGIVYVWRSHDDNPPTWEIPEYPMGVFSAPAHLSVEMTAHSLDYAENTFDYGHITQLHGFASVEEVTPVTPDGPVLSGDLLLRDARFPLPREIAALAHIDLCGVGCIFITMDVPIAGIKLRVWAYPTPIAPNRICLRLATSLAIDKWQKPSPLRRSCVRLLNYGAVRYVLRENRFDRPIWRHKIYTAHPRLIKRDGPYGAIRHWARQFYPEGALTTGSREDSQ